MYPFIYDCVFSCLFSFPPLLSLHVLNSSIYQSIPPPSIRLSTRPSDHPFIYSSVLTVAIDVIRPYTYLPTHSPSFRYGTLYLSFNPSTHFPSPPHPAGPLCLFSSSQSTVHHTRIVHPCPAHHPHTHPSSQPSLLLLYLHLSFLLLPMFLCQGSIHPTTLSILLSPFSPPSVHLSHFLNRPHSHAPVVRGASSLQQGLNPGAFYLSAPNPAPGAKGHVPPQSVVERIN